MSVFLETHRIYWSASTAQGGTQNSDTSCGSTLVSNVGVKVDIRFINMRVQAWAAVGVFVLGVVAHLRPLFHCGNGHRGT
jgi:hypothetical protein